MRDARQDKAMHPAPRARLLAGLAALAALAALAILAVVTVLPPSPRTDTGTTGEFVAARAFHDVQAIGAAVHVVGSDAAAGVRSHIVDELHGMGIDAQVREGIGQTDELGGPAMAYVRNVVAEIPGTDPTGRLFLMAHYDSVQVSYGANDDGSGVATLLEVARALISGPPLKNDVILVFTDGEEACLCGAESFVASDPLAAGGGVVLNFESRGANGPSVMFETGDGNADLIAQYAAAAPYPVATSMAVEVYRILPNDTDFTPFRTSGRFTGLNSAYIDGSAVYHSPQDRPEYLDLGTLQQHGDNALALTRQLGGADLAPLAQPAAHDSTYFPVLGTLVRYPGTWVWPIAVLAALAVGAAAFLARRRGLATWGRQSAGFGLMLVPLIGAAVVAQLFWMMLVALRPDYGNMIDPWNPTWFRFAVCALVALAVVGWYALWRRRFGAWSLWIGALAWLAVLGVVLAAVTPGGSYLAALPALAGAVMAIVSIRRRAWWVPAVTGTVAGAVGVVILVPTVLLFFPALGLATGAAAALFAAMAAFAALPVFEQLHPVVMPIADGDGVTAEQAVLTARRRGAAVPAELAQILVPPYRRSLAVMPTAVLAILAVAFTGVGLATDRFDAAHPKPTQLMYAMDADTGQAFWASQQDSAHGWLAQFVSVRKDLSGEFPFLHDPLLTGPAKAAALPAARLTMGASTVNADGTTTFDVHVQPQRPVRLIDLSAPGVPVRGATVTAGAVSREVEMSHDEARGHFQLLFHAPPADGITVRLTVRDTQQLTFQVLDGSDGLEDLPGFVPRPPDVGIEGSHTSELVLVAATKRLSIGR
jgi:hypothetical protein